VKCLIIAAGQGTRFKTKGEIKPLVPLLGVPLIERVIRSAVKGGADDFYVVTGYQGEKVANFLKRLSKRLNVAVTIIQNDDWQKENGFSVLKARDVMKEPFLLLMADHLFDPCIIWALQEKSLNKGEVLLAVKPLTISTVLTQVFSFVHRQYLKHWNVLVKFIMIQLYLLQYGF